VYKNSVQDITQDKQFTVRTDVTFRRVHATIGVWKSNTLCILWMWMCVCVRVRVRACSLSYPACSAHAPYCYLWPVPLCSIFPHSHKGQDFGKKKLPNTKCVFWFHLRFCLNICHSKKNWARYDLNVYRCSCEVPLFLSDCKETWYFMTVFRKILKYQISWESV